MTNYAVQLCIHHIRRYMEVSLYFGHRVAILHTACSSATLLVLTHSHRASSWTGRGSTFTPRAIFTIEKVSSP